MRKQILKVIAFIVPVFFFSCKQEEIFIDTVSTSSAKLTSSILYDIDFLGNNGAIVGANGTLFITHDAHNWQAVSHAFGGTFYAVDMVSATTIVITTSRVTDGQLLISTDGGNSWSELMVVEDSGVDFQAINENTWVVLSGGKIKITGNAGASWSTNDVTIDAFSPSRTHFVNQDTGYVIDFDNKMFVTYNGGVSWQQQFYGGGSRILVLEGDNNLVMATGSNSYVSSSTNKGFNWYHSDVKLTPISEKGQSTEGASLGCADVKNNSVITSGTNSLFISTNRASSFQEYMDKDGLSLSFNGVALQSETVGYGVTQTGFVVTFKIP